MKKATFILLSVILSSLSFSQTTANYYYTIYQADKLTKKAKYDSALILYEHAFKQVDYVHSTLLKKAKSVAKQAKNKTLCKKYKRQLKKQKKCPKQNKHILEKVDSIFKWDQHIRLKKKYWNALTYYKRYANNEEFNKTPEFIQSKKLRAFYLKTDSSNVMFLIQLIKKHGYIGEEMIGSKHFIKVETILLHFDRDTNNTILKPILKQALANKKTTPFRYAVILDRHLYNTKQTQTYWTWFMIDSNPNLSPQEIKTIIKLREKIGLWGTDYSVSNYNGTWMLNNISRTAY